MRLRFRSAKGTYWPGMIKGSAHIASGTAWATLLLCRNGRDGVIVFETQKREWKDFDGLKGWLASNPRALISRSEDDYITAVRGVVRIGIGAITFGKRVIASGTA
jgi:hypothetical protein